MFCVGTDFIECVKIHKAGKRECMLVINPPRESREDGSNAYMKNSSNNEIQRFAFVPTFCVLVKTEVVPIKMNSH